MSIMRASGQILEAAYVPLLLLALAGLGVMRLGVALRAGIWTSIISLGLFALLAVRRTTLTRSSVRLVGRDGSRVRLHMSYDATRHRLLNGLDEIALTLAHEDAIAAYETAHGIA